MFKFLKNPFGKEEEKAIRKTAEKEVEEKKQDKLAKSSKKETRTSKSKSETGQKPAQKESKGMLEAGYGIFLHPHATEKTARAGAKDIYSFAVSGKSNKIEIKKAFSRMYGIRPIGITIENMPSKGVRFRGISGSTSSWKKANIRVPKGSNITVYEGV